jgi:UDP-glucose 4-epimerase
MSVKLLVTGGAGYVGSVNAAHLVAAGHEVVVLDDLSTGHRDAVPTEARFIEADLATAADEVLAEGFDGVLHFAAKSLVGESVQRPELYWRGNVVTAIGLLDAMLHYGTPRLVFSSTAATYGEPEQVPIREDAPTRPTNPYGASKLAIDHAIGSYARAHGLAATSLRYFNVAGAHGRFGERHAVETHLIPLVLQVASGQRESAQIFGSRWPTRCPASTRSTTSAAAAVSRSARWWRPAGPSPGTPSRRTSPPAGPATPPCSWPPARRRARRWVGARRRRTC